MNYRIALCAAAVLLTIGCGQKASTRAGGVVSAAPVASFPGRAESREQRGAIPAASLAPVPTTVDCSGAQPVWVNERTKVYHVAGDPYYGRTKRGRYLCPADARREGYREAATGHSYR